MQIAPKIIVPVAPKNPDQARTVLSKELNPADFDIIEWRVDAMAEYLQGLEAAGEKAQPALAACLEQLRASAKPVLATWRSEDPATVVSCDYRTRLNQLIAVGPDLIDIELARPEAPEIAAAAGAAGIKRIISAHNFALDSRQAAAYLATFKQMHSLGEIAKLAVNTDPNGLKQLEDAGKIAAEQAPTIVIAMGQSGQVSRTDWAGWGNWASFASAGYTSAPGQVSATALAQLWRERGWR